MWCCIYCKRPIEEWCCQPGSQHIHHKEIGHKTPEYDKTLIRNSNEPFKSVGNNSKEFKSKTTIPSEFKFLYNRKVFVAYCQNCKYHLQFHQSRM